jgi:hypothetical protein
MFQYAAGRAIADRNAVPLYLDTESDFRADPFGRSFALGHFQINATLVGAGHPIVLGRRANVLRALLARREITRMRWLGRHYDPLIAHLPIRRRVILGNYCQSENYFKHIRETIRSTFQIAPSCDSGYKRLALQIASFPNPVCIHARRLHAMSYGRIIEKVARHFGQTPLPYYQNAGALIRSAVGNPQWFIFSDDLEWAFSGLAPALRQRDCGGARRQAG